MCQMSIGHMLLQTGIPPLRFWHAAGDFVDGLLALRALYRFDGILVSLHGHAPDWEAGIAAVSRGPEGERVRWKDGGETLFPPDDLPIVRPSPPPVRPAFERFDPASLPPRIAYIPVSQGLRFRLDQEHLYDAVERVVTEAGREYSVHGEVTSPLDYVLDLFGFEQTMLGFVDDPGRAAAVLERYTAGIVGLAEGLAATGVDAVKISSPFAGAGFLSAAFYRTFVEPYERRIVRALEARNVRAYIHTCGDIHDRLELMAETGASGHRVPRPSAPRPRGPGRGQRACREPSLHQGQHRSRPRPARRRPGLGPGRRRAADRDRPARRALHPQHGLFHRAPDRPGQRGRAGRGRGAARPLLG